MVRRRKRVVLWAVVGSTFKGLRVTIGGQERDAQSSRRDSGARGRIDQEHKSESFMLDRSCPLRKT